MTREEKLEPLKLSSLQKRRYVENMLETDSGFVYLWDILHYLDKNCDKKYYKWKFWKEPMFDWTITNVRNGMHVVVCNNINADFLKRIYVSWEYKEKSLEDQPDECIDFIYSLVKDA